MALTFGNTGAPSNVTTYLDSVFAQSLVNYNKSMTDNIGATNALLHAIMKNGNYKKVNGGLYIAENLVYAINTIEPYDGYDEFSTGAIDGVGQAQFEFRQLATPIAYNMREVIQNREGISDLVETKIMQADIGIQEGFAQHLMWGNVQNGGALTTEFVGGTNNRSSITPLGKLVSYQTNSLTVGNISEATFTFWKNKSKASAATTYDAFMYELQNMYNLCALGTGGPPDIMLMDQVTYQLFVQSYRAIFKGSPNQADPKEWPFVASKFFNATVIMDDKVPDVFSGTIPTLDAGSGDPASLTYGSCYFLNSKFFKLRYIPGRDFELLKDENGKAFVKPINGDSRVAAVAWMGNTTISNRRKNGVLGKIARTLTV